MLNRVWPAVGGAAALAASAALLAQDAANDAARADIDREPLRCITVTRLERTEVVGDRTVLFYMRDGDVYRNRLARSCPGLEREKRFTYRVHGNQLCSVDTITVLESRAFGLSEGFTCALGDFRPITEEEAERLAAPDVWPGEVEVEAVELPDENENEDEAAPGSEAAAADEG
jgi:hypothetical protein